MLVFLTVASLALVGVLAFLSRRRASREPDLGVISQQWIAQHRADRYEPQR
jgi:hypothetical protein